MIRYIVEIVMAILLGYIVFAVLSLIFPGLSKLSKLLQHYNDNAYNICIRL